MQSAYKNLIPSSSAIDPFSGQTFNDQANIFTVGAGYLDTSRIVRYVPRLAGTENSVIATSKPKANDSRVRLKKARLAIETV